MSERKGLHTESVITLVLSSTTALSSTQRRSTFTRTVARTDEEDSQIRAATAQIPLSGPGLDTERFLTCAQENGKLKNEMIEMETAVQERLSYLQRHKDMATFKIASLQKALDDSVPAAELDLQNR